MSDIHSVDVEDDQFAYRYDTQLLIDRRDEDLDEDVIADYITEHFEGNCLSEINRWSSISSLSEISHLSSINCLFV